MLSTAVFSSFSISEMYRNEEGRAKFGYEYLPWYSCINEGKEYCKCDKRALLTNQTELISKDL